MVWSLLIAVLFQQAMPVTTVERGAASGVDEARQVVVRSAEEWQRLWTEHRPAAPLPVIDFARSTVIAVFLGTRPTAGFDVEVLAARNEGDRLTVEYRERHPAPGAMTAQVLTAPYHIVRVPRHDGEVRFTRILATP